MAKQTFIGNMRQAPVWLKEYGQWDYVLPIPVKLDPTQFTDASGVTVTVTGTAAQNATSAAVTALTPNSALANTTLIAAGGVLIPAGTVLYFGGAKVATLTADAKIGDTTITVAALPTALAAADVATYSPFSSEFVPSGTFIGRTWAERDASTSFGPAATSDDELFLTVFDRVNVRDNADAEVLRHQSTVAENFLPGYGASGVLGTSASPTALLTKLRTLYRCIQGAQ